MNSPRSNQSEVPSGEIVPTVLFNESHFASTENNRDLSLQLLSNCVYFTNCTILRERKLLPEEFFVPFPVYDDIYGYLVNQKNTEANKLSAKLNSIDAGIRNCNIHKLALLIEENLNTNPVETYIWHFVYDTPGSASAEIGYHGRKMTFTVRYDDMEATMQNFCKLYKDLQQIFKELRPLPPGLIPSLKVAYKGDPEFVVGYEPVNDFVDVNKLTNVGSVSFPFNNGFCLLFASDYAINRRTEPEQTIEDHAFAHNSVEYSPLPVESTRRKTMGATQREDETSQSVFDDSGLEDALLHGSMACNRNVSRDEQQMILQSEVNAVEPIEIEIDREVMFEDETTPKRAATKMSREKKSDSVSKRRQGRLSSPKKSSRKSDSPKPKRRVQLNESPKEPGKPVQKKKAARRLVPVEEPDVDTTMDAGQEEDVTMQESPESDTLQIDTAETPNTQQDSPGRDSVLDESMEHQDEPMEVDEPNEPINPPIRYGHTEKLQNLHAEVRESNESESPMDEDESQKSENYGRVRSLLNITDDDDEGNVSDLAETPPERRSYGRVSSILNLLDEENEERIPEVVVAQNSKKRYGRVPSINSLSEITPRGRPGSAGKFGRSANLRASKKSSGREGILPEE